MNAQDTTTEFKIGQKVYFATDDKQHRHAYIVKSINEYGRYTVMLEDWPTACVISQVHRSALTTD